ncbi:hypothetical protein HK098_001953 [Nowakowskiella sp. JEL0407]|nr:hypothetical protein HK098_001953 [Nowakowskiella sp. JEL0407]
MDTIPAEILLKIAAFLPSHSPFLNPILQFGKTCRHIYLSVIPALYLEISSKTATELSVKDFERLFHSSPKITQYLSHHTRIFHATFSEKNIWSFGETKDIPNYIPILEDIHFSQLRHFNLARLLLNASTLLSLSRIFLGNMLITDLSLSFLAIQDRGETEDEYILASKCFADALTKLQRLVSFSMFTRAPQSRIVFIYVCDALASIPTSQSFQYDDSFTLDEKTGSALIRLIDSGNLRKVDIPETTLPVRFVDAIRNSGLLEDVSIAITSAELQTLFVSSRPIPKRLTMRVIRYEPVERFNHLINWSDQTRLESLSFDTRNVLSFLTMLNVMQCFTTITSLKLSVDAYLDDHDVVNHRALEKFLGVVASMRSLRNLDLFFKLYRTDKIERTVEGITSIETLESLGFGLQNQRERSALLSKLPRLVKLHTLVLKPGHEDGSLSKLVGMIRLSSPFRLISFVERGEELFRFEILKTNLKIATVYKVHSTGLLGYGYHRIMMNFVIVGVIDRIDLGKLSKTDYCFFRDEVESSGLENLKIGYVDGLLCAYIPALLSGKVFYNLFGYACQDGERYTEEKRKYWQSLLEQKPWSSCPEINNDRRFPPLPSFQLKQSRRSSNSTKTESGFTRPPATSTKLPAYSTKRIDLDADNFLLQKKRIVDTNNRGVTNKNAENRKLKTTKIEERFRGRTAKNVRIGIPVKVDQTSLNIGKNGKLTSGSKFSSSNDEETESSGRIEKGGKTLKTPVGNGIGMAARELESKSQRVILAEKFSNMENLEQLVTDASDFHSSIVSRARDINFAEQNFITTHFFCR